MPVEKKPMPHWLKLLLAASAGGAAVQGGEKLATDSPVHFAVVGDAPIAADGWTCEPEGGIVGAPMVCRPQSAPDVLTDDAGMP